MNVSAISKNHQQIYWMYLKMHISSSMNQLFFLSYFIGFVLSSDVQETDGKNFESSGESEELQGATGQFSGLLSFIFYFNTFRMSTIYYVSDIIARCTVKPNSNIKGLNDQVYGDVKFTQAVSK